MIISSIKRNNPLSFLLAILLVVLAVFFISQKDAEHTVENIKQVKIARRSVKVDLALSESAREKGLSGRRELLEDTGMLFIFDKPGKYYFWMKDMNFAIDIIWISEEMKVVYIKKDAHPAQYLDTYGPDKDAKYVLEVVAGFSDTYDLKEGDEVSFIY